MTSSAPRLGSAIRAPCGGMSSARWPTVIPPMGSYSSGTPNSPRKDRQLFGHDAEEAGPEAPRPRRSGASAARPSPCRCASTVPASGLRRGPPNPCPAPRNVRDRPPCGPWAPRPAEHSAWSASCRRDWVRRARSERGRPDLSGRGTPSPGRSRPRGRAARRRGPARPPRGQRLVGVMPDHAPTAEHLGEFHVGRSCHEPSAEAPPTVPMSATRSHRSGPDVAARAQGRQYSAGSGWSTKPKSR